MSLREKVLEGDTRNAIKRAGGWMLKFESPGTNKVPDNIVIWPGNVVHFAEFKKEDEGPDSGQKKMHKALRAFGVKVFVINTREEAVRYVETYAPK